MVSSLFLSFALSCCFHLIIFTSSLSSAQPLCNEDESSALLQFKRSFFISIRASIHPNAYPKVESWKLNGNASDCCLWDGVECDHNTGHVIGLDLSSSFLYGSINSNSSLFNLVHLRRLNLADNHFNYSQIPTQIGSLTRLRSLNLSHSAFSGQIPLEISSIFKLAFLDLSQNVIYSGDRLLKLEKLSLRDLVQNLTNLKVLSLGDVNISSKVPSVLSNRSSLTFLDLRRCLVYGEFPSSISQLKDLQVLRLTGNHLSGKLEQDILLKLPRLTRLDLSFNDLTVLTTNITNATLPKFTYLGLSLCNLREFPDFLRFQNELDTLFFSENQIHGQIPAWLWNTTKESMRFVNLAGNFLTGFEQSPDLIPWQSVLYLSLGSNQFQGSLPVPPPSTVHYLVADNSLAGEISPSICRSSSLSTLDLSDNNLTGTIPQCLANSSEALVVLDLHSNNFIGIIPQTFTTGIEMIDLRDNELRGQVPPSLANCTKLQILVLGNNHIEDTFPFWLGALPDLQVLILQSNEFHGSIENVETNLAFPKLRIIDLSYNGFSGNLPSHYFKNWNAMKMIKLGELSYMNVTVVSGVLHNTYTYSITIAQKGTPREYPKIQTAFVAIDLSNNKFSGKIPESLGSLSGLKGLNISNNNLTGAIPPSLARLMELEWLDLSQNMLSGKIPQQLTQLTFLEVLDVSHNHLTGRIPRGKQFDTFESSSYDGNPELCGVPLSRSCENTKASPPPPPQHSSQGDETEFPSGIFWMVIFMGYGSGLIVGLVIGTTVTRRYHEWFVETFGRKKKVQKMQKRMEQGN